LALVDAERDWSDAVPAVLGPRDVAGQWRGASVGPGTGDNMAGALGVGLRSGDVAVSVGTSGTVYSVCDTPTADPSGIVAGFADATGRHLPLACTLNATKVTDAVARLLGVGHEEFDELVFSATPGAGGLTLLPYLDGERTPDRPSATGVISGMRSDVSREQLARAAVEGVVCGLLDGLDALAAFAPADGRLIFVGGGARSRAYRQVLADLSGRAVLVPSTEEQVATGACVQAAAVASGADPNDVADRWKLGDGEVVEPGPASSASADVRAAYATLRDATASA
jgi:xylulokinase